MLGMAAQLTNRFSTKNKNMLKLLLPILFPSWRFFSSIGPSPRIQISFLQDENAQSHNWQAFRPLPARVSFWSGLGRLLLSPERNETLFINTCAERLFDEYSPMREQEIMRRILAAIARREIVCDADTKYVQFRICAVMREGQVIAQPVVFISKPNLLKPASATGAV